ncbi:hypothetical protein [Nocardioides nanhaiensis]
MNKLAPLLATGAAMTLVVGLLTGIGWPGYVIGAVLALSLWVMLFAGSYSGTHRGVVDPVDFAIAAVVGLVIGFVVFLAGDEPGFWAVGVIMGGVLVPAGRSAQRGGR